MGRWFGVGVGWLLLGWGRAGYRLHRKSNRPINPHRRIHKIQPRRRWRAQDAMKGMHRPASQMPPELELPRAGAWAFVLCLCGEWTIVIVPLFSQL